MKRVPWDYTVTPEELIGEFSERLKQEASGILNWALPGLAGYVAVGKMVYPQKIVDATNQPRRNGDHRPVCKGASHPEAGCAGWGHRGSLGAAIEEICGVVREQLADFQNLIVWTQIDAVRRTAGERFALSTGKIDA